ncbi:MAG: translation initiation factor eIF-2B [Thermoplasmatota archaeon]
MAQYQEIINDIRGLRIQGAINVAKAAVDAFEIKLDELFNDPEKSDIKILVKELLDVKKELFGLRSTEPALRNAVGYLFVNIKYTTEPKVIKDIFADNITYVRKHFSDAKETINRLGAKRIGDGSKIFTHCHASTVTGAIISAKNKNKKIIVHNTETRPLFQGRKTAEELSENGIEVVHFVDSAGRLALKNCDLMLIGADAILSDGTIINKIGSEMFAEIAKRYDTSVYICTDSWKFDPASLYGDDEKIEMRDEKEIWDKKPKNVTIKNYAFEKINPGLINGIICELGIFKPEVFVSEVLENYPWMKDII